MQTLNRLRIVLISLINGVTIRFLTMPCYVTGRLDITWVYFEGEDEFGMGNTLTQHSWIFIECSRAYANLLTPDGSTVKTDKRATEIIQMSGIGDVKIFPVVMNRETRFGYYNCSWPKDSRRPSDNEINLVEGRMCEDTDDECIRGNCTSGEFCVVDNDRIPKCKRQKPDVMLLSPAIQRIHRRSCPFNNHSTLDYYLLFVRNERPHYVRTVNFKEDSKCDFEMPKFIYNGKRLRYYDHVIVHESNPIVDVQDCETNTIVICQAFAPVRSAESTRFLTTQTGDTCQSLSDRQLRIPESVFRRQHRKVQIQCQFKWSSTNRPIFTFHIIPCTTKLSLDLTYIAINKVECVFSDVSHHFETEKIEWLDRNDNKYLISGAFLSTNYSGTYKCQATLKYRTCSPATILLSTIIQSEFTSLTGVQSKETDKPNTRLPTKEFDYGLGDLEPFGGACWNFYRFQSWTTFLTVALGRVNLMIFNSAIYQH